MIHIVEPLRTKKNRVNVPTVQPAYIASPWARLERAALREAMTLTIGGGATKASRNGHPRMLAMRREEVSVCMCVCMSVRVFVPASVCVCLSVCVCVCVFIKLHITTQSGPVILVILCHSH